MSRVGSALLFLILGAAGASVIWWLARPEHRSFAAEFGTIKYRLGDLQNRISNLAKEIERRERSEPEHGRASSLPATITPRSAGETAWNEEVVARLAAIEAALAKIAEQPSAAPAPTRGKPVAVESPVLPPPKAKDQTLVNDLLAKGTKEPGSNTKTYFGLTPREIHQTFGKPDHTKWLTEAGHHDWFYLDANGTTALHVRFEGGIVIHVWP